MPYIYSIYSTVPDYNCQVQILLGRRPAPHLFSFKGLGV